MIIFLYVENIQMSDLQNLLSAIIWIIILKLSQFFQPKIVELLLICFCVALEPQSFPLKNMKNFKALLRSSNYINEDQTSVQLFCSLSGPKLTRIIDTNFIRQNKLFQPNFHIKSSSPSKSSCNSVEQQSKNIEQQLLNEA